MPCHLDRKPCFTAANSRLRGLRTGWSAPDGAYEHCLGGGAPAQLDDFLIHGAEYLTGLPLKGVLLDRLQQATRRIQLQIEQRKADNGRP